MFETVPQQTGCRYFLRVGAKTKFNCGFRSKAEVDEWIEARVKEHGLDWRAGYAVKLRGGLPVLRIVTRKGVELSP